MRGKKKSDHFAAELRREISLEKKAHADSLAKKIRRLKSEARRRKAEHLAAKAKFKPRKKDFGQIVFVGLNGKRESHGKKGWPFYVTKTGKKQSVRQYRGGVEKAKYLSQADVSSVRDKKAATKFVTATTIKVSQGVLIDIPNYKKVKKINDVKISGDGTRFHGKINDTRIDIKSNGVARLAKALKMAIDAQDSKKTLLVTVGLVVKTKDGTLRWFSTKQQISRMDSQKADESDLRAFFGRKIYAFLAREMTMAGIVMTGSAGHISRLKHNRGKERKKWTKDGLLWEGHDSQNASIVKIEYRFDQLTFTK